MHINPTENHSAIVFKYFILGRVQVLKTTRLPSSLMLYNLNKSSGYVVNGKYSVVNNHKYPSITLYKFVLGVFYAGTKHSENNDIWCKKALHFLQLTDLK